MNINNVYLETDPATKTVQMIVVENNEVISKRDLADSEKCDYLRMLIDDMLARGISGHYQNHWLWSFQKRQIDLDKYSIVNNAGGDKINGI